jgi:hypothetical protein
VRGVGLGVVLGLLLHEKNGERVGERDEGICGVVGVKNHSWCLILKNDLVELANITREIVAVSIPSYLTPRAASYPIRKIETQSSPHCPFVPTPSVCSEPFLSLAVTSISFLIVASDLSIIRPFNHRFSVSNSVTLFSSLLTVSLVSRAFCSSNCSLRFFFARNRALAAVLRRRFMERSSGRGSVSWVLTPVRYWGRALLW